MPKLRPFNKPRSLEKLAEIVEAKRMEGTE